VEILIEGEVQGVGYRAYAQRKALALGVTGYAMNLRNGAVKLHVEGPRETIETLLKDLEKGPPLGRVTNCSVQWGPPTHRYSSFSIRLTE
jgi:acylphosphatase